MAGSSIAAAAAWWLLTAGVSCRPLTIPVSQLLGALRALGGDDCVHVAQGRDVGEVRCPVSGRLFYLLRDEAVCHAWAKQMAPSTSAPSAAPSSSSSTTSTTTTVP